MFSEGFLFSLGEKFMYLGGLLLFGWKSGNAGSSSHPLYGGVDTRCLLLHYSSSARISNHFCFSSCFKFLLQLSPSPFLVFIVIFTGEDQGKMGLCHLVWTESKLRNSSCNVNVNIYNNFIDSQSPGRDCKSKCLGTSPGDSD